MVSVVVWLQLGQVSVDCSSAGLALLPGQQEETEATLAWGWVIEFKGICSKADSPTMASVSPRCSSNDTLSTARTSPRWLEKSMVRLETVSSGLGTEGILGGILRVILSTQERRATLPTNDEAA